MVLPTPSIGESHFNADSQWMGWESDGSTIGSVIVEVWEELTRHVVHVKKLLSWLKVPGRFFPEEQRKAKLRVLAK